MLVNKDPNKNNKLGKNNTIKQQDWELVAEGDWLVGQRFKVKGHAVLGRDSSCDITIPGTHLSRRHAELTVNGNVLLMRDLNSSNGTYVNNQKISETELKPGDTIRFDVLLFRIDGPKVTASDFNATVIQREPTQTKNNNTARANPESKNWKTKPTSVGNRNKTVQMTTVQKATSSLSIILAIAFGLATIAALGYLFTQL